MKEARSIEDVIRKFLEHVTAIRILDRIIDELFRNTSAREMMDRTAPEFMRWMNILTHNSLINGLCRITERAETHGNANLTVEHLVEAIDWTDSRDIQAQEITIRCKCFHRQLKKGRNKIGAHNDFDTALDDRRFELPKNICKQVIEQLECLMVLAHEQLGIGSRRVVLGANGDVLDFRKALGDSLLFDRALADERLPPDLRIDIATVETRSEAPYGICVDLNRSARG